MMKMYIIFFFQNVVKCVVSDASCCFVHVLLVAGEIRGFVWAFELLSINGFSP